MRLLRAGALLWGVLCVCATFAYGQSTSSEAAQPGPLRVALHCQECDTAFLKTSIAFVEFVAEDAEVDVTVSAPAGTGSDWRVAFAGRGRFAGRDRAVTFAAGGAAATEETRRELVRYTTEERLNQIMQIYRDHGVQINNPHVYIVEDGKQNHLDPAVVGMKRRFDPQGLLNPGKLRSWYTAEPTAPVQAPVQTPVRQTA